MSSQNPKIEIVTVTPELATKWLRQNTHNRNLRPRAVTAYARDMTAGNWRQNGESVKFASDGTLLDGQHRLHAVVAAGVPVAMLIVSGLAVDTQETMDAGARRSAADVFGLRGEVNSAILSSVLRRVWMWERGDYKFTGNPAPTTSECAAVLAAHPEVRRSVEIAARIHGAFKVLPQSITGTAHWVLSGIDQGEAVWFFARVGDGADLASGHPVLTLRNRLMAEYAERRRTPADRQMAYVIRAWNAVRTGRPLSRIIQAPTDDMPMPQ